LTTLHLGIEVPLPAIRERVWTDLAIALAHSPLLEHLVILSEYIPKPALEDILLTHPCVRFLELGFGIWSENAVEALLKPDTSLKLECLKLHMLDMCMSSPPGSPIDRGEGELTRQEAIIYIETICCWKACHPFLKQHLQIVLVQRGDWCSVLSPFEVTFEEGPVCASKPCSYLKDRFSQIPEVVKYPGLCQIWK
jgi:hypothetical protein